MATDSEVIEIACYLLSEQTTIRNAATEFKRDKQTIHRWMSKRLCELNKELYDEVKALFEKNKAEMSKRGGKSTYLKHEALRKCDIIELARYIVEEKATLQQTAEKFDVNTYTVYKYMIKYLPNMDKGLYDQVIKAMINNKVKSANRASKFAQQARRAKK